MVNCNIVVQKNSADENSCTQLEHAGNARLILKRFSM